MQKIFISHSTSDGDFVIKLMDLLQTQFGLIRDNFFLTSDEELAYGENWIEQIRSGMNDADIILPIVTPNFLESKFCLCELGATWANQKALIPVIIPPLDHNSLDDTPYRRWLQSITLNSVKDIQRLAQAIKDKKVGDINMVRFTTRAEKFFDDTLTPFVKLIEKRKVITQEEINRLYEELTQYKDAYSRTEEELDKYKIENEKLRNLKDADEVRELDFSQMEEWDTFINAVEEVKTLLYPLSSYIVSILFHDRKSNKYGGFIGEQTDNATLRSFENEGYIKWDEGWVPDYDNPKIIKADNALEKLNKLIHLYEENSTFYERFEKEYEDIRLSLMYTPFWEKVLGLRIFHSNK